jgi:general secretion pathway protein B
MSLILEALKKSERQRHFGEAPTFTTPIIATRRSRSLLPFLAVVIVLALGVGWWLLYAPETPPAGTPVASTLPSTTPPDKPAGAASSYVEAAHDASPAASAAPMPASPTPAQAVAKPAPANGAATNRVANNDTIDTIPTQPGPGGQHPGTIVLPSNPPPVLTGPAPRPATGASAASGTAAIKLPVAMAAKPPNPPAAEPREAATAAPAPPPTVTNVAVAIPAANTAPANPAGGVSPAQASVATPPAPALPTVWDLPYSMRKSLPEITLTMHVYSVDPHGRFVIIAGDRHVEGDDLGDGVTLHEIRADGMVLDFHGQRFLYPRDGR